MTDAGRLDAHDRILVGVEPSAIMTSRKLAAMATIATRTWPGPNGASASGIRSSRRFSNVPATAHAQPPGSVSRRHQHAAHRAAAVHARDVNGAAAQQHLRLAGRQDRRGRVHRRWAASVSTSTIRPGCSVCADRTNPHTAAPAKSVTSSPGNATAPRVATTNDPAPSLGQPRLQHRQRRHASPRRRRPASSPADRLRLEHHCVAASESVALDRSRTLTG